jgi:hypothetical protein
MARVSLLSAVLFSALAAGPGAWAGSAYSGLTPVAGDAHQHASSLISNFVASRRLSGRGAACPHNFGEPTVVYRAMRSGGYDWGSLAHHDRATDGGMTGDPHGLAAFGTHRGAYQWWTDPSSKPLTPSDRTSPIVPDPKGLPDYVNGGAVSPGWNEALSLSSAADAANDPAGGFVAFAGREYTTNDPPSPPELGQAPKKGGHKVVLLPGSTDRICGPLEPDHQGDADDCDETQLYDWVDAQGGVIIQAHPVQWYESRPPARWHPETMRGGLTDRFVQGLELGNQTNLFWEDKYQLALRKGFRFFPAFGSDRHNLNVRKVLPGNACKDQAPPGPQHGATLCWVPTGGMTRRSILDAMRARNCYYARSHAPRLEVEIQSEPTDAPLPMGSLVSVPDHQATVRVLARNALPNQSPAVGRRLDRIELVDAGGKVVDSCQTCCKRGSANVADVCDHTFSSITVPDGALYARVCELAGNTECGTNGPQTVVIGAPVFINWSAFKSAHGISEDERPKPGAD